MRITHNSGASLDDADLKDENLLVECKVKGKMTGVSIPKSLLDKVKAQAIKWRRDWAIVTRNTNGEEFITLPLDVFAEFYECFNDRRDSR